MIRILLIYFFLHVLNFFFTYSIVKGLTSGLLNLIPLSAVNPVFVFVFSHSVKEFLFP